MNNREKIISAIEKAKTQSKENAQDAIIVPFKEANMIIDLLKEQEAVRPERQCSGGGTTWWNVCGNCRTAINPNDKFCHECGKRVKWND